MIDVGEVGADVDEVESFTPLDSSQKAHHAKSIKKKTQLSGPGLGLGQGPGLGSEDHTEAEGDIDGGPGHGERRFSMEEFFKQGNALGHGLGRYNDCNLISLISNYVCTV